MDMVRADMCVDMRIDVCMGHCIGIGQNNAYIEKKGFYDIVTGACAVVPKEREDHALVHLKRHVVHSNLDIGLGLEDLLPK